MDPIVVRFAPPPDPSLMVARQVIGELRNVGTFDPSFFNEVRQNATPPLGADGFAIPTLLSVFAAEDTQFHNGAAVSIDAVLRNVTHRSAMTRGGDTLSSAVDRVRVAAFVRSIDASTLPIP